ncbi:MAG TPA: hypothetical protein VH414_07765 [Lichenihabitans sp.]|jgi:hypothetical protein|nr:hypothetical protein [Lichenihabitans sp.]
MLNKLQDSLAQAEALKEGYWNNGALQMFAQDGRLATAFLEDLVGFAQATEQNTTANERIGVCKILMQLTVHCERGCQYGLYEADKLLFGSWLMYCMRAVNVTHHSTAYLKGFKTLFSDLNIPVEGGWDMCESMATFGGTEFYADNGKFKLVVSAPNE